MWDYPDTQRTLSLKAHSQEAKTFSPINTVLQKVRKVKDPELKRNRWIVAILVPVHIILLILLHFYEERARDRYFSAVMEVTRGLEEDGLLKKELMEPVFKAQSVYIWTTSDMSSVIFGLLLWSALLVMICFPVRRSEEAATPQGSTE